MSEKRGKNWKPGSRAVPGSGKVGYLGKLRKAIADGMTDPHDQDVQDAREDLAIRERMRKYVEREGKK